MKLEQFEEVVNFDEEIDVVRRRTFRLYDANGKKWIMDKMTAFRSKFRRKIKDISDHHYEFTGNSNGNATFSDWQNGFEFALSLSADTHVVKYVRYSQSINTAFFYKQASLDAAVHLVGGYKIKLEELRKLVKVAEVMSA